MIGEYDCYHVCEWVVSALEKHGVLEDRYATHDESGKVWSIKHDELLDILKHCDIVPPIDANDAPKIGSECPEDFDLSDLGEDKAQQEEGWRDR